MHRIAAVVAGLSLAFVGTSTTFAATINVPGDHATIQDAINASANGDVILIQSGVHYVSRLNTIGKAITIEGQPDGSTVVEGDSDGSTFVIVSGESNTTHIKNLIIQGGAGEDLGGIGGYAGGRIYIYNSGPKFENCVVRPCDPDDEFGCFSMSLDQGGGAYIHSYAGQGAVFVNCTFTGNEATYGGGLLRGGGDNNTLSLIDCEFTANRSFYYGSGMSISGSTSLTRCTITANEMWGDNYYGSGAGIDASDFATYVHLYDTVVCGNYGTGTSVTQIEGSYWASDWNYISSSCDYEDQDGDGFPDCGSDGADCIDQCPEDPNKIAPGQCGCGIADTDTDDDGTSDCLDNCPNDPLKTEPGDCGCGIEDTNVHGDINCDGVYDIDDAYAAMDGFGIDNVPTGSCCVPSGCHAIGETACADMGGTWLGEDSSCDDCAPTCQGDANADGKVDVFDLLKVIDGWGTCP